MATPTASRPNFIELPSNNSYSRSNSAAGWTKSGVTSPRIQHFDGDVPPSMSPLDAIAARSRRLAKELEETRKAGERRMSRLPPQVVTESLTEHQKTRPPIFRALSDNMDTVPPMPTFEKERAGSFPKVANPTDRPASQHVRMSAVVKPSEDPKPVEEDFETRDIIPESKGYFDAPRVESPPPLEVHRFRSPTPRSSSPTAETKDVSRQPSTNSRSDPNLSLAPPMSHSQRLKPSNDASDDDYTSSNAGSTFSQSRKLSSSSGMSAPHSPASVYYETSHVRNGSGNSLDSPLRTSTSIARNFSRPMSSSSLNNMKSETSPRKTSLALRANHLRNASSFETPAGFLAGESSSYTHAKYSLPRGRNVSDRNSGIFAGLSTPQFEWQEPMFTPPLEAKSSIDLPMPSPFLAARPSNDNQRSGFSFEFNQERSFTPQDQHPRPSISYTPTGSLRSNGSHAPQTTTGMPPPSPLMLPSKPLSTVDEVSSRSESTIRPTTGRSTSNYQALSTDEHVDKAIALHEEGALKESTYHLRIAANKGNPTGMLLYALACRHGWGMRANPKEGVKWLRKAVDVAMADVADDEDPGRRKTVSGFNERQSHRAQFALAVYELGVSHLNGWGIEQDKALALRCFEIAGNWGDTDALSEAGFCYAEGIGCKKDMKKAAKFYRMAEKQGVSMIGNSWIHKDKYASSDEETENRSRSSRKTSSEKQSRSKSKSRGIFSRKKTVKDTT